METTLESPRRDDICDLELGLNEIRRIRPVRYRYTGDAGTVKDQSGIGIVGQEIEEVIPETVSKVAVNDGEAVFEDLRVYNSTALTYVLINSVKQLSEMVEQQQAEIAGLRAAVENLANHAKKNN